MDLAHSIFPNPIGNFLLIIFASNENPHSLLRNGVYYPSIGTP
jgi:hypothetical protein